jgi:secreted trypsin-like serine protease
MTFIYLLLVSFFLYNIDCVSSVFYSCDRNADCGCSKTNADLNKIVGGESAVDSSWGWAVSLRRISTNEHFCGGAIISPLHIITAAHCLKSFLDIPRNVKVVVGINRLNDTRSSMAQERSIVRAFSHPAFDDDSNANDIAILRLNQSLNISNEKGTARLCLAHVIPTNTANNYPIPDSSLIGIGWGLLKSEDETIPSDQHLQQVTLKAISAEHRMCATSLNNRQLQFCAGVIGGGKGT